jgi:hypothetical protein
MVIPEALFDTEIITDRVELVFVALADGVTTRVRMFLPEGNKLGAKAKTNDGNVQLFAHDKIGVACFGRILSGKRLKAIVDTAAVDF